MKHVIGSIVTIITTITPVIATPATWNIDPDHSNVDFKVLHLMAYNARGNFKKNTGIIELDEKDITKSRVAFMIDTNSITTNIQKRDEHLRSKDFFDVSKYPNITFVSKNVARVGNDKLKITGDMTIHGTTKQVVLDVDSFSKESKDSLGNTRRLTSASTKINRKDFGLFWNKALESSGVVIGEEVTINLEIEMIKVQTK
jgi:polyisoprenoid-binding protein YceI